MPENNKLIDLDGAKLLYDDLRERTNELDEKIDDIDVPVQDVQVDGTSIVGQNGVANIPVAGNEFGVVKTDNSNGIYTTDSGKLRISAANSTKIKGGNDASKPIVPTCQHEAAFYGLAKAAGDTTQSASSNAVGTYTDEALVKIQKMLGIYQAPWELINETTTTEDVTQVAFSTDSNDQPLELTDMIVILSIPPTTTGTRDAFYNEMKGMRNDGIIATLSLPSITHPVATSNMLAKVIAHTAPGMPLDNAVIMATSDGNTQNRQGMAKYQIINNITYFRVYQSASTKSLIPAGSNVKLYGRRKWN